MKIKDLYIAQTQNVREINKSFTDLKRLINKAIQNNNLQLQQSLTKSLTIIYSTWTEARFLQLTYTPFGLNEDEINQVLKAKNTKSVVEGWEKLIELSLKILVKNSKAPDNVHTIQKKLKKYLKDYILGPSQIRNKLAHGQWTITLNVENTNLNPIPTKLIEELTVVDLIRWKMTQEKFSHIIESLIESPEKHFRRSYQTQITDFENFIKESSYWTVQEKRKKLVKRKLNLIPFSV